MNAAGNGKLDCLDHLIAKGANVNAADGASAAQPAAPSPLPPRPPPSPPAAPAAPPSLPPLTACGSAAASAGRQHGPHEGGCHGQARLPRAPRHQGRQPRGHKQGERRPASRPQPPAPSPSTLAARRPCCPALTAAADRVWRRRRASAERRDGSHACGSLRQARLPRAPHRQGRQPECPEQCAPQPCCGVAARGVGLGGERGRLRTAASLPRRRAVPRRCRCAPPPTLGRPARMQAGRGASGAVAVGERGVGWGVASASGTRHPPARHRRSPACVGPPPRLGRKRYRRCTSRLCKATLPASSRCSRQGPTRASRR
eukprot:scaffold42405_cov23-Phaeocystis_antarctica.AAC.1